jgi:hypothetical protein
MPLLDEGAHIAEEEGQHQGADMGAVHVRIGHDEHLVVPQLGDIELVADAAAQCQHHRHQLVVAVNFIGAGLFHVQHLAPQRQNGLNGRVASHLGRAACRVALDDENFGAAGVFFAAVCQLAGHPAGLQRALAAHQFAGLFGGGAGAGGLRGFFKNGLCHAGILLKELHQLGVDHVGNEGADLGIAQLCLGLAFKFGFLQLDRDDADQTLAHVCAGQILVLVLQQAVAAAVIVEHAGQAGLEALFVGAAVRGVDVVGKAQKQLVVAGIVLQSDLRHAAVGLPLEVDDVGVQHFQLALFAQIGDKALDAALVAHDLGAVAGVALLPILQHGGVQLTLIGQGDLDTGVQEAFLPQALFQRVEVVDGGVLEHLRVGFEGDPGAGDALGYRADALEVAVRVAAPEGLLVLLAVAAHIDSEPLGAGVDHRSAHAVQAAGHLVAGIFAAELAAGVQDGVHHGDGGQTGVGLNVHGDATSVIGDLNDIVLQDLDLDVVAVTRQRLVNGVVHDLVHQMMQTALTGGADIHTRALAHRLQTLQHLDLAGVILVVGYGIGICTGNDFFCHILSPFCSFLRLFFQIIAKREPVHHGVLFSRRFVVFSRAARRGRSGWHGAAFRAVPGLSHPSFFVDLPPVFRKFHSTIFCALRRMAALDSSERYTASTSPPSAST